jgi:murein DD-endopeptidase MepM/ murein hydrolase activator NlpD
MPNYSGTLQLNDILIYLTTKIRVDRQSFNNRWQTLRTQSSVKSKSGFSIADVFVTAEFTDDFDEDTSLDLTRNGYDKLRDLVSQFRVTPFCYVENSFLRDKFLSGNALQSMALVLKQMEIIKTNEDSNVITVQFHFCWFNYFPFTRNFHFRKDWMSGRPISNPVGSIPWKLMYTAEQARHNYRKVKKLNTGVRLSFNEWKSLTANRYREVEEEAKALKTLRNAVSKLSSVTDSNVSNIVKDTLFKELNDKHKARSLEREIFGDMTSMAVGEDGENVLYKVTKLLDQVLDPNSRDSRFPTAEYGWRPLILRDGSTVSIPDKPTDRKDPTKPAEYKPEETIMIQRKRTLDFNDVGLITQGISISFENILAVLPLVGHPYPTYQHMGSIDAQVSFSIVTTDQKSIQYLSDFYSVTEDQHHKYRNIPAGHRNILVDNDLINMCGLKEFLPERFTTENIDGEPGTWIATLSLLDNPLTAETQEKIGIGQSFTSSVDLRLKVAKILQDNLKFDKESVLRSKDILFPKEINRRYTTDIYPNHYKYSGEKADSTKAFFASKCEEYGKIFSQHLIGQILGGLRTHNSKALIVKLLLLNDDDILGMSKANEDLSFLYQTLGEKKASIGIRPDLKQLKRIETERKIDPIFEKAINATNISQEKEALTASLEDIEKELVSIDEISSSLLDIDKYIQSLVSGWIKASSIFLDEILRDSNVLSLPDFDSVRKAIRENRGIGGNANAYSDFPLEEVLGIMESKKNDENVSSIWIDAFGKFYDELNLGMKNIGMSALINPDFYFFNPVVDVIDEIFPYHVINKAKESIIASRTRMRDAEKSWFQEVYDPGIIGNDKTDDIWSKLTNFNWWMGTTEEQIEERTEKQKSIRTKEGQEILSSQVEYFEKFGVMPDGLQGVCGPSNWQAEQNANNPPTTIKGISAGTKGENNAQSEFDTQSVHLNYRAETKMEPSDNSSIVRHRFGTTDALEFHTEAEYSKPLDSDPNKDPIFVPPTESTVRVVTSKFGWRTLSGTFAGKELNDVRDDHKGIDIAGSKEATLGSAIYAAAEGKITKIVNSATRGVRVHIDHANGYRTIYAHLQWEPIIQEFFGYFQSSLPQKDKDILLTVNRGDQIGRCGNTGFSSAAHLHFEIRKDNKPIDPLSVFSVTLRGGTSIIVGTGEYKSQTPLLGIDPNNESLFYKSIERFEKDLKSGQGYGMMRAYPTFKLYFIESDLGERKRYAFDDFFSYNAVQEIQVIRHRKIAADLCVIQLTNISGSLNNREFFDVENPNLARTEDGSIVKEKEGDPSAVNTAKENPIASLMLQTGTQIQLRLGFSNNPEELEKVFNGVIVDYEFSKSTDLVTIICQSFAIELVQTIQGEEKSFGGWFSDDGRTWQILNSLLAAPEVVHFGRWEAGGGQNKQYGLLHNRWNFKPKPQDDNLFPPQGSGPNGLVDILISPIDAAIGSKKYIMYNTTLWDVFQELTLRHPGYIASAVPYDGEYGPRMSMFFGLPDQLYFSRDATLEENNIVDALQKVVKEGFTEDDYSQRARDVLEDSTRQLGVKETKLLDQMLKTDASDMTAKEQEDWIKKTSKLFAKARGSIRPFRSYHVATSSLHILHNSIATSAHNTFNTVTLQYSDDEPEIDEDTRELRFDDPATFTLKADAGIPDEEMREMFAQYPNCNGYEMAKLYSVSLLFNSLKEVYGGSLIIIGNPSIKPHDIVYIFDEYNDMFGPIEVEKVVHRMSQKNGFITEITPDLCVHVNQESTLSTQDAMGLIAEHGLKQIGMESLGSIVKGTTNPAELSILPIPFLSFSPIARMFYNQYENQISYNQGSSVFGSVGTFIFRKLITRTQLAQPFRFSPLVLSGKPMIGGLPNKHTDGSFLQPINDWFKESAESIPIYIDDTYDKFKANYWFGNSTGDFSTVFFGGDAK